ncbi:MAG: hypothetical protein HC819_03090 [Cyclobacteriaceae bacterium]|nr:hypothetical protein [Cyclobacteriaceae bacterium]
MKKKWRKFITSLKPVYNVDVTLYHFIPGMPVKENRTRHSFGKGALDEAKSFFDKASQMTRDVNVAPVEISLIRGKKRVVYTRHFGPVKALKQMKISA